VEESVAHDEALAELVIDLLGRAPRCRLALSGKACEQLSIQGVRLATTGQRASEQRDLARVDDAYDVVGLMQGDGERDPVAPSRFSITTRVALGVTPVAPSCSRKARKPSARWSKETALGAVAGSSAQVATKVLAAISTPTYR
jgi:hypothetical protein